MTTYRRHRLAPYRHTALLAAIIAVFLVRPFVGDSKTGIILYGIAALILVVVAIYNIDVDTLVGERKILLAERRRRMLIVWGLGIPAIFERIVMVFEPNERVFLVGSIIWAVLIAYITWCELRAVLRQKEITREVISMAISTYLLMGFTWGLIYVVMHNLQPNAFNLGGTMISSHESISVLLYFSLTTLSTIGFGDITPISMQARYLAVAEGITGNSTWRFLVARLVGMQMSQPPSQPRTDS